MSVALTTAPVRPFQRVLESLATRMGWDPARIQQNQSAALTAYLNTAMKTVWNFYPWPEIMQSLLLPATDGVIPWQATPVTSRVTTTEITTNGTLLSSLTGWSQAAALFTFDDAGGAAFSVGTPDVVNAEAGFYQTKTGLTPGATYRLKVVLADCVLVNSYLAIFVEDGDEELFLQEYYQTDLTDGAVTLEQDVVATADGIIALRLSIFPPGPGTMTGRITEFTLHATALVRSAPRPPIDMVVGIYTTDPLETDEPEPMPFRLGPGCLHLTGTARDATEGWVHYRPACPQFTNTAYAAATSYQAGGLNELAFDSTTGHVYRAQSLIAFTAIAVTNPAYWLVQGVPERFVEALIQLARAEALEEQDQFAKAMRARATGLDFLENAMLTHYRQSGQTRNYRCCAA